MFGPPLRGGSQAAPKNGRNVSLIVLGLPFFGTFGDTLNHRRMPAPCYNSANHTKRTRRSVLKESLLVGRTEAEPSSEIAGDFTADGGVNIFDEGHRWVSYTTTTP